MTDSPIRTVPYAQSIAEEIGRLTEQLALAPPREAARILAAVLNPEDGILGRLTGLMITGAQFAKLHSEQCILPPEVCLAMGRAANELHDIVLDLDALANPVASLPATTPKPVASALVVRRRR
ncbi:hypothetical protein [Streptomyces scabiei]|uniref:hypothetical protein n=1 Tax=Streptomyces scabiei TaxID=1930 RepID=UPI0029B0C517|nr:hypothetical protein [Streptomyces scabiei]MDX3523264.1 hypothetical protein [Streptomyces scabiei]